MRNMWAAPISGTMATSFVQTNCPCIPSIPTWVSAAAPTSPTSQQNYHKKDDNKHHLKLSIIMQVDFNWHCVLWFCFSKSQVKFATYVKTEQVCGELSHADGDHDHHSFKTYHMCTNWAILCAMPLPLWPALSQQLLLNPSVSSQYIRQIHNNNHHQHTNTNSWMLIRLWKTQEASPGSRSSSSSHSRKARPWFPKAQILKCHEQKMQKDFNSKSMKSGIIMSAAFKIILHMLAPDKNFFNKCSFPVGNILFVPVENIVVSAFLSSSSSSSSSSPRKISKPHGSDLIGSEQNTTKCRWWWLWWGPWEIWIFITTACKVGYQSPSSLLQQKKKHMDMKHMFVLLTEWLQWRRGYIAICNLVAETTDSTKRLWFSCKKTKKESSARGIPIVGKRKKIGVRRGGRVSDRVFLSKGSPQSACEACKIKSSHTDLIEATEDEKVRNRVRKHSLGLRKRRWREDKKEDAVCLQPVLESSRARPLERAREKRDTRHRENEKRQERCDVMLRRLKRRELGATPPRSVATHVRGKRVRSIELASHKEIVSAHNSGINSLQVPLSSPMNEAGASIYLSIYLSIWYIEMLLLSFLFFFSKSFFKMFVFLCCDDDDDPWRTHWLILWLQNKRICLFVCKIGGCRLMEAKHATYWQELLMDQWECMIHNKPLPSTPSLTLPSMRPCSLWTSRCRKDTCTLCLLFNGILWILVSLSLAHLTTTSICGTQIHCRYPANPPPPPPSLSFCFPKKKH